MTKTNNCATVVLTAVFGLFAFVPTVDAASWRVIAEDPKFPTDDVIVAFFSVTDSQYKLPADPSTSDCTPAIRRALNDTKGMLVIPYGYHGQLVFDRPKTWLPESQSDCARGIADCLSQIWQIPGFARITQRPARIAGACGIAPDGL